MMRGVVNEPCKLIFITGRQITIFPALITESWQIIGRNAGSTDSSYQFLVRNLEFLDLVWQILDTRRHGSAISRTVKYMT